MPAEFNPAFTPEELRDAEKEIDRMKSKLLFGIDMACASPEAEQFFLLAISSLDQAQRYLRLAQYAQSRTLT